MTWLFFFIWFAAYCFLNHSKNVISTSCKQPHSKCVPSLFLNLLWMKRGHFGFITPSRKKHVLFTSLPLPHSPLIHQAYRLNQTCGILSDKQNVQCWLSPVFFFFRFDFFPQSKREDEVSRDRGSKAGPCVSWTVCLQLLTQRISNAASDQAANAAGMFLRLIEKGSFI